MRKVAEGYRWNMLAVVGVSEDKVGDRLSVKTNDPKILRHRRLH